MYLGEWAYAKRHHQSFRAKDVGDENDRTYGGRIALCSQTLGCVGDPDRFLHVCSAASFILSTRDSKSWSARIVSQNASDFLPLSVLSHDRMRWRVGDSHHRRLFRLCLCKESGVERKAMLLVVLVDLHVGLSVPAMAGMPPVRFRTSGHCNLFFPPTS